MNESLRGLDYSVTHTIITTPAGAMARDDRDSYKDGNGDSQPLQTLPAASPALSSSPPPSPYDTQQRRTAANHAINVLKSFIGSNYLSVPFAFAAAGSLLGPLAVAFIASVSGLGCLLLVQIRNDLLQRLQHQQQHRPAVETYPQVAGALLGRPGYYLVEVFLIFTQMGYCIGYVIYMSTAIHQFAGESLSLVSIVFGLLALPLFCLCLVPDLKHFLPFTFLSNVALLVGFLAVFIASASRAQEQGTFYVSWGVVDARKLPLAFGNIVASFEGIGTILSVEGSMASDQVRGYYPLLLKQTLLLVAVLFSAFGIVGFGAFGKELCSVILTNLPTGEYADVARVALIVGLFFTYGFQMYPVYQMIDLRLLGEEDAGTSPPFFSLEGSSFLAHDGYGALHSPPSLTTAAAAAAAVSTTQRRRNNIRAATYVGVRMGVVLFSSAVAYLVPEFELLVALVGSIGAGMLAFIMPGVLGWTMYRETATRREKGGYGCLIAFGVVGGGIGAGYALHDLIYGQSQC